MDCFPISHVLPDSESTRTSQLSLTFTQPSEIVGHYQVKLVQDATTLSHNFIAFSKSTTIIIAYNDSFLTAL